MPVQKESTSQNIVGEGKSGVSSDRLQAVARGDNVPAEVHQSVFDTKPVLKRLQSLVRNEKGHS